MPDGVTHTRKRRNVRLPSRRAHILGAVFLLLAAIGIPVALALYAGDASDALPDGSVQLEPVPETSEIAGIDETPDGLPDLLAGDVPEGENPTDSIAAAQTDALGNPIGGNEPAPDPKRIEIAAEPVAPPLDTTLTRSSQFGPIPGPNASGRTALQAYSRPASSLSGRKPVSIIVGGLGINPGLTRDAIEKLPADVTLSFAAHARGLQAWIDQARAAGHDVLLEVPMESASFDISEPGADRALTASASPTENIRNLHYLLSRAQGYVGVINYNGDVLLTRSDATAPILDELSKSGLGFITDGSFPTPSLPALSDSVGLPHASGFGLIDPSPDSALIAGKLSDLSAAAQDGSGAIGVGFAYPETVDAVRGWAATLSSDGLILVPASAALK